MNKHKKENIKFNKQLKGESNLPKSFWLEEQYVPWAKIGLVKRRSPARG